MPPKNSGDKAGQHRFPFRRIAVQALRMESDNTLARGIRMATSRTATGTTVRRVFKKIKDKHVELSAGTIDARSFKQTLQSYFGVLKHCAGFKVRQEIIRTLLDTGLSPG